MFDRILVANRGEIACRVFRTCRTMGVTTVAVYSDADVAARHVREADLAVRIGPAPARQSYLDAEAVVAAAVANGVDAIHPGYGFLSEKLELIDACAREGIAFIGPHRDAIARMGSKIESKRIARAAGVPCVPGYDGDDQDDATLADAARSIGFPLLIKASAGGGGKGMKRVDAASAFASQLVAARSEAQAAFGDDRVLLERYIERPRHLEVQLLGDRHGNLVHLFERECSIQRNYQKLIEEAPAAHLSDAVRAKLFEASLQLGRAIGYDSVGTVEFVLEAGSDAPYFLEMNTRLQVEHPVTELTVRVDGITLDLVAQQIRAAAGEPLAFAQSAIVQRGWAIEARINAEIPDAGFEASFGPVTGYAEPEAIGVRVDSGIDDRSEITPHYDAMIAKAIAYGPTRDCAKARLHRALSTLRIEGVRTNQALLADVIAEPAFDRELTTRFLADTFGDGWKHVRAADDRAAAAAAWFFSTTASTSDRPLAALTGFRLTTQAGRGARCSVVVGAVDDDGPGRAAEVRIVDAATVDVVVGATTRRVVRDGDDVAVIVGDETRRYRVRRRPPVFGLWCDGDWRAWSVVSALARHRDADATTVNTGSIVAAGMPGVVTKLFVGPGDAVAAGAAVAVVEAMKLLHTLVAPRDGVVATVSVHEGQTIERGRVLMTLEAMVEVS
jgi:3-methylcrotonyl-CoA carboxylase alpha subunit